MEHAMQERRTGSDRRGQGDRRRGLERRSGSDRRDVFDEEAGAGISRLLETPLSDRRRGGDRRSGHEKRIGIDRRCGIDRRVGTGWRHSDLGDQISPESALELVSDFYSASMDERFWPTALTKLATALNAEACALARHDFARNEGRIEHAVGLELTAIDAFTTHYALASDWLVREDKFRNSGEVVIGEDLVSADDEEASEFFTQWLAPQSFRHQAFAILERQGAEVTYLYTLRGEHAGPFGPVEIALLQRLLPYLQRSLRAGLVLRRTQAMRQVAMQALDVVPIGVMLVSASGAVLGANRVARDVLSARDILVSGRGGLEVMRDGRRTLLRDLIAGTTRHGRSNEPLEPHGFSVSRASGQRALSVLIWPVAETATEPGWDEAAAVVFLGDPDRSANIDQERLRQLYGLTRAEARVAADLAQGYRLDEIAVRLDVAYETTRKHLKKVLSKIETDRQADLVRTIVTGPGAISG